MSGPANLFDADAAASRAAIGEQPLVLVDFWAQWCGPCRALKPVVAGLAEAYPGLTVVKVDVDANESLAEEFGIESLPSLLLFKAGECVERFVGRVPYIVLDRAIRKQVD